jgi:hypothetical protein
LPAPEKSPLPPFTKGGVAADDYADYATAREDGRNEIDICEREAPAG